MSTALSEYDAWYDTPRGRWIGEQEFRLTGSLLRAAPGATLLDVGSGTGYFSRRFQGEGYRVTALDPDIEALQFALQKTPAPWQVNGSALALPFADDQFDHAIAVTSLCFTDRPADALAELYRVSRYSCVLGLLNRHSLLCRQKADRGAYRGARWDTAADVLQWAETASVHQRPVCRSAVFLPGGGIISRWAERLIPVRLLLGGFLAVAVCKRS